ncbi:DUF4097 family beta strand repeat-containing protein [Allokutzneria sp. NRRL B-24872]|uniref:DUF4097 family beta strand repeat-containing protein n=1 Tax=Allokutzneria sp. NRRL B-24872 TaxID=1137961 RepID=UPI000A3A8CAD|nr:DUF4097 family beta strand repeat-containing protein [Allokutzneria sp. NRRL B-24872]
MKNLAAAVLAVSFAVAGSGCAVVNKATEEIEYQSDEFGAEIKSIDLTNLVGAVTVTGTNGGKLTVKRALTQQSTRKSHAKVDKSGSALKLVGECSGLGGDCEVAWDVEVPKGVAVKVVNKSGDVTVKDVEATEIDARSKLGDVAVNATGSFDKLDAHSESGEITVTVPGGKSYSVTAKVKQRRGKADIQVRNGSGPAINVSSERGDVTVKNA